MSSARLKPIIHHLRTEVTIRLLSFMLKSFFSAPFNLQAAIRFPSGIRCLRLINEAGVKPLPQVLAGKSILAAALSAGVRRQVGSWKSS